MQNNNLKVRIASIMLIAAGYGWAGGHYIPANSPAVAYIFQLIIITVLLVLGIGFLSLSENEKLNGHWSIRGLSIFTALSLLANIANIIHGAFYSTKVSYGSHNSFADLVPIGLIIMGTTLWLITLFQKAKLSQHA
jgi:hypothetical protein